MFEKFIMIAYLVASILFIFSLDGLSKHETSKNTTLFGIFGMAIALIFTILSFNFAYVFWIIFAMIIGGIVGIFLARKVEMTELPELVAILHSFVGLAAILVGFNSYLDYSEINDIAIRKIHLAEIFIGIFIGSVTFTGSIVAFKKLRGHITSRPIILPYRHQINFILIMISFILMLLFVQIDNSVIKSIALILMTIISLALGWSLVVAIGGADMPVVVSMLNAYSGWTASTMGFILSNDLLIITGALVGSSGTILSYIMCKAMNRSLINVIFGNFESTHSIEKEKNKIEEYQETTVQEVTELLKCSHSVIITPGYGMAVAHAQSLVYNIATTIQSRGGKVLFGIHPVAGRLPGHMNVLLAEAKVPYDIVLEMDEINNNFIETDTVLVIGANDTVNPASQEDPNSPIFGMPVLEVWKAKNVIIFKRSMNTGYSGIQNPLFFKKNVKILFGDAKQSAEKILREL